MESVQLQAQKREETGNQVAKIRNAGRVPAVVYGHGFENQNVSVHRVEFERLFEKAGESTLIDLAIDGGETVKVLIHDVQKDPVSDVFTHIDFRAVNMKEKIDTEISLVFVGVAPAVKEKGGIFVSMIDSLHVKALPIDLVHELEVDISLLVELGDKILVQDLNISDKFEVLNDPSVVVALAEAPRVVEEAVKEELTPEEAEKAAIEATQKTEGGEDGKGEVAEGDKKE